MGEVYETRESEGYLNSAAEVALSSRLHIRRTNGYPDSRAMVYVQKYLGEFYKDRGLDEPQNPTAGAVKYAVDDVYSHFTSDELEVLDIHSQVTPKEAVSIWFYLKITGIDQKELSQRLDGKDFQEDIGMSNTLTETAISRITNRIPPQWREQVYSDVEELCGRLQGGPLDQYVRDLSDGEFIFRKERLRELTRRLRRETYGKIRLRRGHSSDEDKGALLRPFVVAGQTKSTRISEANTSLELKDGILPEDTFDPRWILACMRQYSIEEISRMFIDANSRLFEILCEYGYLTDDVEVSIDTTHWKIPFYGEVESPEVHQTARRGNYPSEWRYITLSVVGHDTPVIVRAMPIHERYTAGYLARRMLNQAAGEVDISQVYMDSEFYQAKVVNGVEEIGADYVIRAENKGKVSEKLVEKVKNGASYAVEEHGVADLKPDGKHLVALPELKSRKLSDEEDSNNVQLVYTNRDVSSGEDAWNVEEDFRTRWGVETNYRVLSSKFLPTSNSKSDAVRSYYFNLACHFYNMWTVANAIEVERKNVDIDENGRPISASDFMKAIEYDPVFVDAEEERLPDPEPFGFLNKL